MPLTELEKPEVIAKVKEQHKKQLEKLKLNKNKKQENNPFLKGAAEVFDEVQQHSALAKKVHAAFIKGRKEIGAWTNLSDSPYISQRNRALGL